MNRQPKVTILILNWNGATDTLALLKDLEQLSYPNYSILIVDNGSTDDSLGQIARYMEQRRRHNQANQAKIALLPLSKNFGYAEGNNKGAKQIEREKADYLLLLNNDTLVEPQLLDRLVEAAETESNLAAVGPTIYWATPDGTKQSQVWFAGGWLNFAAGGAHHRTELPATLELQPTQFLTGCCLLLMTKALTSLDQLFDPTFFAYGEDTDLCLRLERAGWQLGYVPKAKIWHKLAASSGGPKSANFWYYNVRNNFLIVSRYGSAVDRLLFIGYFLFYKPVLWSLVGAIIRPRPDKWHRLLAIAQGSWDAMRGRYGKKLTTDN